MQKRNSLFFVLGVAVVMLAATGGVLGGVATCERANCPPGPVALYFQYENCTGEVEYVPQYGESGVCNSGNLLEIFDDYMVRYTFPTSVCDRESVNATYGVEAYTFGLCHPPLPTMKRVEGEILGARDEWAIWRTKGIMFLPNVNASYEAPQEVFANANLPSAEGVLGLQDCYSTDNCTLANGEPALYWRTTYDAYSCASDVSYSRMGKMDFGACYNLENKTYVQYQCLDERTFGMAYSLQEDCSTPYLVSASRRACNPEYNFVIHCTATPPIIPQALPTSSPEASSNTPDNTTPGTPSSGSPTQDPSAPNSAAQGIIPSAIAIFTLLAFLAL